jgi:hypothetical protein
MSESTTKEVSNMDEEDFKKYLKRGGRSQSVLERVIRQVKLFEQYLQERDTTLDNASPGDLEAFVEFIETDKKSAKNVLWAICYYYEYTSNGDMRSLASTLRGQRIKKKPFSLKDFRGVNTNYIEKLATKGIKNVDHMLQKGKTAQKRQLLSEETGIPVENILELVKLSDLSRIPGVKGIRARLYYDAGADTVENLAEWDPEALRVMLTEFVDKTAFDGIPPLPKEAASTVKTAKNLPKIVEY